MSREESDSEPALDDPSSHDIEQRADTWFFKVIVRLDNRGDFSEVLNARRQQLERGLSISQSFHGLQALTQVLKIRELNNMKALCMIEFLESNSNGILQTRVARESRE